MPEPVTPDQVVTAAKELGQDRFTRSDLESSLGVERSELKPGFKAARQSGRLEKVGEDAEGKGQFQLTGA